MTSIDQPELAIDPGRVIAINMKHVSVKVQYGLDSILLDIPLAECHSLARVLAGGIDADKLRKIFELGSYMLDKVTPAHIDHSNKSITSHLHNIERQLATLTAPSLLTLDSVTEMIKKRYVHSTISKSIYDNAILVIVDGLRLTVMVKDDANTKEIISRMDVSDPAPLGVESRYLIVVGNANRDIEIKSLCKGIRLMASVHKEAIDKSIVYAIDAGRAYFENIDRARNLEPGNLEGIQNMISEYVSGINLALISIKRQNDNLTAEETRAIDSVRQTFINMRRSLISTYNIMFSLPGISGPVAVASAVSATATTATVSTTTATTSNDNSESKAIIYACPACNVVCSTEASLSYHIEYKCPSRPGAVDKQVEIDIAKKKEDAADLSRTYVEYTCPCTQKLLTVKHIVRHYTREDGCCEGQLDRGILEDVLSDVLMKTDYTLYMKHEKGDYKVPAKLLTDFFRSKTLKEMADQEDIESD